MKSQDKIKFTVNNQEIRDALSITVKSAGTKSSLPIIANKNICFVLNENSLYIYATNLEHGVKVDVLCNNEINADSADISFVAPYDNLNEILKDCPQEVTMIYDTKTMKLSLSGKVSKVNIKCMDAQEYPILFKVNSEHKISIDPLEFSNAVSTVLTCSAEDTSRPTLHSVNFSQKNTAMQVAGADGYRLGVVNLPYKNGKFSVNIPASSAKTMSEVLVACTEDVWVNVDSSPVFVCGKNKHGQEVSFFTLLIEGTYPDFAQIIPKFFATTVVVDIAETLRVLSLCKSFLNTKMIKLLINQSAISVNSTNEEGSEYDGSISPLIFTGHDTQIALNVTYLSEVVSAIKRYSTNKNVVFKFNGKDLPMLIHPEDDENAIFVIMPMHIGK